MRRYKTSQEEFWANNFGDEYIERNKDENILAANINLFSRIIKRTEKLDSIIEFGANIGLNLKAINVLCLNIQDVSAVEINAEAAKVCKENTDLKNLYEQSIFDFKTDYQRDFVLIKGVLIHLNPDYLNLAYNILYETSKKYICIAEYYNPTPVEVMYRGHKGKLFKRDFAGEMLDKYNDLKLIDYGFVYRRDANFPQDDITWFLMQK